MLITIGLAKRFIQVFPYHPMKNPNKLFGQSNILSGTVVKNPPANVRDAGLIPGSGRPPGEGNGNLLQYSFLENPNG